MAIGSASAATLVDSESGILIRPSVATVLYFQPVGTSIVTFDAACVMVSASAGTASRAMVCMVRIW